MEYFSQGNFIFKNITTIQECLCYIITFSICMIILLMLIFYFCCWRYRRYIYFMIQYIILQPSFNEIKSVIKKDIPYQIDHNYIFKQV